MGLETQELFNHKAADIVDKLALVGELEHLRRHALRAAHSSEEDEDIIFYLVLASQARTARRDYMAKHFRGLDDKDWCLVKSAACLRQLAYETASGDEDLNVMERLVDDIFSNAFGEDMTGCKACAQDREEKSPLSSSVQQGDGD